MQTSAGLETQLPLLPMRSAQLVITARSVLRDLNRAQSAPIRIVQVTLKRPMTTAKVARRALLAPSARVVE